MTVNNIGKTFAKGAVQGKYAYKSRENRKFDESLVREKSAGWREQDKPAAAAECDGKHTVSCLTGIESSRKTLLENCGETHAAVQTCRVRHISKAESDFFQVYAAEGYSLKAKVFQNEGKVYLEQKSEDGSIQAYEVTIKQVQEGTQNTLEQAAVAAWKKAEAYDGETAIDFDKAMLVFYERVEEQIKNGPPKFWTGGSEFSEKEWKKLIEELDGYLEEVREEQCKRMEKQRQEDEVKQEHKEQWEEEDAVSRELIEKLLEDREEKI